MMTELEWKNPPPPGPRKVDVVAQQLMARPGEWACIAKNSPNLEFMPWWGPIYNDVRFEVKFVRVGEYLGPKDVYARAITPANRAGKRS